jgi:acyl carrier protein
VVRNMLGESVVAEQPLMEAGIDSVGAIELQTSLASSFGVDLPATAVYDHPTAAALARHLAAVTAQPDSSKADVRRKLFLAYEILVLSCVCRACEVWG